MRQIGYLIALLGLAALNMAAQTPDDVFLRGNEFYRAGRFAEAAREYESITKQGYESAPLLFNLGNAYYRMGEIPQAILAFERACRLDPGDPDIQMNLRLANLRIVDRIEPVPEMFLVTWLHVITAMMPPPVTTIIAVTAWILLFLLLTFLNLFPRLSWMIVIRWGIIGSGIAAVLFGALLAMQVAQVGDENEGIVTASVVTAKNSPDAQSVDAFVIHGGLKVQVTDQVGDWIKITLADGKVGWVHRSEVEQIKQVSAS